MSALNIDVDTTADDVEAKVLELQFRLPADDPLKNDADR
jgi:hypothetical protein